MYKIPDKSKLQNEFYIVLISYQVTVPVRCMDPLLSLVQLMYPIRFKMFMSYKYCH